jgi:hypothetical protein
MEQTEGLNAYCDIRVLDPDQTRFEWSEGGFLRMHDGEKGTDYPRVNLHRSFPLTFSDEYISVRDHEGKEIGMIRAMEDFSDRRELLLKELDRRYFTPVIEQINSIKEEFGYSYWNAKTDAGPFRFTVRSGQGSVQQLDVKRVMVIDADGNRFLISDATVLTVKELKLLEPLLSN